MRRVYPQVLQAEQTVQELRSEISEYEASQAESHAELNEKTHDIQDLRSSLGAVERRKAVRKEAISKCVLRSRQVEQEIATFRSEELQEEKQMQMYFEENQYERGLLERAALERSRVLQETKCSETAVQNSLQVSQRVELQRLGTSAELQQLERENDCLEDELSGAAFHSSRQRLYLAMEETEASTQFHNTCEAKEANLGGQSRGEGLEALQKAWEERLRELVEAMHEGDVLDGELRKASELSSSLQFTLSDMYEMVRLRGETLQGVSSDHLQLRRRLEDSEQQAFLAREEANELTAERDVAERQCHDEEVEFQTAEAQMFLAESQLQDQHAEADAELQKMDSQRANASEKVEKLKVSTASLQQNLQELEGENRHLQSRIAFFDSDTREVTAENESLERTIEQVKKKVNCVIS